MANPFAIPQPSDLEPPPRAYRLHKEVSLSNQEIQAALRAAVLAKAGELSPLGKLNIPALSMDAQMAADTNTIDSVSVLATVEVTLQPLAVTRLLHGDPAEPEEPTVIAEDVMVIERPAEARSHSKNLVSKALEKLAAG